MARFTPRALLATVLAALALVCSGCEFWQYNIANGNSDDPPRNQGQYDVMQRVTSGERPVAMTLNEVCRDAFNQMDYVLAPYGYTSWFDQTSSGAENCPNPIGYGNAIFHLGQRDSFPGCSGQCSNGIIRLHYATNYAPHHSDALGVGIRAGNLRALVWVTHLEAFESESDGSAASAQASQLLGAVRYWQGVSGLLPVVGGDFNLTPVQPPMGDWCGSFRESFGCSSGAPTHPRGKIDYLFSSIRWNSAQTITSSNSDHKRLIGRLR